MMTSTNTPLTARLERRDISSVQRLRLSQETADPMVPELEPQQPRGVVLIFVLGILALLAILGATVFLATKDDMYVADEIHTSREAFTNADLSARIAAFLARSELNTSAGRASETLNPGGVSNRPEFVIVLHNFSESGFQQLGSLISDTEITQRYLMATDSNDSVRPHVEIFYQYDGSSSRRQLIGTVAVGQGVGTIPLDPKIPPNAFLIISADGRVPVQGSVGGTWREDPSNYFTGDNDAKHGIVTTIWREVAQGGGYN